MDDVVINEVNALNSSQHSRWLANLSLDFAYQHGRSFLANKHHQGPLVVQKVLYPEDASIPHAVIIHPPGGVAGGDELNLNIKLGVQARALLTTPGAGKWYKANGRMAKQRLHFNVAEQAGLEWFPQENILFNGAQVGFEAEVHLSTESTFASWDIVCLGRQAQQEQWEAGLYQQKIAIYRQSQLIWNERANLKANDVLLRSKMGLNEHVVFGTMLICATQLPADLLQACRDVIVGDGAKVGMTALPEVFCARYVGQSSQQAKQYFEALWQQLRPWYAQVNAVRPRIWST